MKLKLNDEESKELNKIISNIKPTDSIDIMTNKVLNSKFGYNLGEVLGSKVSDNGHNQ